MSTVSSNDWGLKLWNGARDGDYNAVVAAIAAGVDVNWNNDSYVSDNDIQGSSMIFRFSAMIL